MFSNLPVPYGLDQRQRVERGGKSKVHHTETFGALKERTKRRQGLADLSLVTAAQHKVQQYALTSRIIAAPTL